MGKRTYLSILIGSFLVFHFQLIAQSSQNQSYLSEIEIVDSIYSETLKEYRSYWVKLPENYDPNNATKYPVVYLLDGFSLKNSLETVYDNYWGHYLPHMIFLQCLTA
jgi:predicted alpha/beta superfamily hydrolase